MYKIEVQGWGGQDVEANLTSLEEAKDEARHICRADVFFGPSSFVSSNSGDGYTEIPVYLDEVGEDLVGWITY